ncbi:thioesterase II family protein [Actinomadura fibrosa]|uniref:Thioesterase II family protein n=1 Tax=Actinomadura fibrosa TaxID=111802 RepID=A0ABW2XMU8_9ACTN|nr:thioesterase domain-containing protein [Actinomadura fibrosa]
MPGNDPALPWIRRLRPGLRSKVLMFCLPYGNAPAAVFDAFAEALAPSVDVLAVRHDVADGPVRGLAAESIEDRADRLVEAVGDRVDRPVALFGHGSGAVLAFELARRLEEEYAIDPVALFTAGCAAPSRIRDGGVRAADGAYAGIGAYDCDGRMRVRTDIFAFGGEGDAETPVPDVLGWRRHTAGEFQAKIFTGGRRFLDEHFAEVVNAVTDFLLPVFGAEVIDIRRAGFGRPGRRRGRGTGDPCR